MHSSPPRLIDFARYDSYCKSQSGSYSVPSSQSGTIAGPTNGNTLSGILLNTKIVNYCPPGSRQDPMNPDGSHNDQQQTYTCTGSGVISVPLSTFSCKKTCSLTQSNPTPATGIWYVQSLNYAGNDRKHGGTYSTAAACKTYCASGPNSDGLYWTYNTGGQVWRSVRVTISRVIYLSMKPNLLSRLPLLIVLL
jgi:hypothetical protein